MITRTTEAAFRILIFLQTSGETSPLSLQTLAGELGGSPTYLAKIANLLVRNGVLEARRGSRGGLVLAAGAEELPALRIVEICQGLPEGAYCSTRPAPKQMVCSYHELMAELHTAVIGILGSRTLRDLATRPRGCDGRKRPLHGCRMRGDTAER